MRNGDDGGGHDLLRRTISGHCVNPNIAGALVCALGCERNNIDGMFEQEGLVEGPMMRRLVMQEVGGNHQSGKTGNPGRI